MIIAKIGGGVGNQMFGYATARRLSYKLNSALKLDISEFDKLKIHDGYELKYFNIAGEYVTPEELEYVRRRSAERGFGVKRELGYGLGNVGFMPEVLDYPDDIELNGCWQTEKYFADIADVIRQDFTLKELGGAVTKAWHKKIRATDCAVSLHLRHGDYVLSHLRATEAGVIPIEYYARCVERLKAELGENFSLFVFSDNIDWAKNNLYFGVPINFVAGCERDVDEMFLMSQCKHNIIAHSTFAWWGAWLNQNPDKKVLAPEPWIKNNKYNHDIISDGWIKMPVDFSKLPTIDMPPFYSIIVIVEDAEEILINVLTRLMEQKFRYYEVLIIDNGASNFSAGICLQASNARENIRLIRLNTRLNRNAARNLAIEAARGEWIILLNDDDCLSTYALFSVHSDIEFRYADVLTGVGYVKKSGSEYKPVIKKRRKTPCFSYGDISRHFLH